jgi:hypothetical protein
MRRGADAELAARLECIQKLTDELAKVRGDALKQQALSERIHRERQAARAAERLTPEGA